VGTVFDPDTMHAIDNMGNVVERVAPSDRVRLCIFPALMQYGWIVKSNDESNGDFSSALVKNKTFFPPQIPCERIKRL
jgi:hypothetical protein